MLAVWFPTGDYQKLLYPELPRLDTDRESELWFLVVLTIELLL